MKKSSKFTLGSLIVILAAIGAISSDFKSSNDLTIDYSSVEVVENTKSDNSLAVDNSGIEDIENTKSDNSLENNNLKTISYKDDDGNIVEFQASDHIINTDEFGTGNYEYALISELPEEDIYLYEHKGIGLILVQGDKGEYILKSETIITPRFILPKIFHADFDKDSEKEILINFYVGSGTGISFEELGMIEKSKTDDKLFEDMQIFNNTLYTQIVSENIEYNIDDKGQITLNFKPDEGEKDSTVFDLGIVEGAKDIDYGNIVHFSVVDNVITSSHELGVFQFDYATPTFGLVGIIKAEVIYKNNKFTLENFDYIVSKLTGK